MFRMPDFSRGYRGALSSEVAKHSAAIWELLSLRVSLVIAPVGARHETANLWTLFLAREIANPDFVLLKIVARDASN